jgi:threonine dehydratase
MTRALSELVRRTPIVPAPGLGASLKLENLQRTGSFKLRGAVRKMSTLSADELARGVIAASAGNHGAGLAQAAAACGARARIVVSALAPANKRARISGLGAEVIVHGSSYDEAEAEARRLSAATGATFVPAFDDEHVIEGNGGDLGRELLEQAPSVQQVVCTVGGGGMIAGLARVLVPRGVALIGVQPAANCAMHDSLAAGRALTVYHGDATIAEGCEGAVCERTYALARHHGVRIVLVTEDAIARAVAHCYRELGQVVESSGAVAVAGLRAGAIDTSIETVAVISGGNIDDDELARLLR